MDVEKARTSKANELHELMYREGLMTHKNKALLEAVILESHEVNNGLELKNKSFDLLTILTGGIY